MKAVRLHGPRDLRLEDVPAPGRPGAGGALVGVRAVGLCGSDLHTYRDARIGDTVVPSPVILGHEFSAVVEEAGAGAADGLGRPLKAGQRVAVDPAQPCGVCEMCRRGHPNLCTRLRFCGLYPDDGAMCEKILVPGETCFLLPGSLDDAAGALLEPLGIALHAVRLSHIRPGDSVAVHGAGPIGLLIVQLARLAGASPVFATDLFAWRRDLAERLGALPLDPAAGPVHEAIARETGGRMVDAAFECGWGGALVQEAAESARPGGVVMLVGIPEDDTLAMQHSTGRRKGLTLLFVRRMKHTYPTAIAMAAGAKVDLASLVSHRFPLERAAEAFAMNDRYAQGVVKIMLDVNQEISDDHLHVRSP